MLERGSPKGPNIFQRKGIHISIDEGLINNGYTRISSDSSPYRKWSTHRTVLYIKHIILASRNFIAR